MSAARKISTIVGAGGKIEVRAPELPSGQPVEVTIRLSGVQRTERRSVIEVLADCPGGLQFKTPDEVENFLKSERDSWAP